MSTATASAADNLGKHLLGWNQRQRDDRDYKIEDFLQSYERMSGTLTPDMTLKQVHDTFPLTEWHEIYAFWKAFKALFADPTPTPTPTPNPPPGPTGDVVWTPGPISDQGQTPHCVGFTGLDWGRAEPVVDQWADDMGNTIYYDCKVVDGEPRKEDGSNTRSLFKVLQQLGRVQAYAFSSDVGTIRAYVRAHGPVAIGVPWDQSMFNPDDNDYVHPDGNQEGGHEILVIGHLPGGHGTCTDPSFKLANHWGTSWGDGGFFYMTDADLESLMARGGDSGAGMELPLT